MISIPVPEEKKIVLVCDDSKLCLNSFKRAMQSRYHVITATSGYEAVAHAALYYPDIILMDLSMYGMSGVQATQRLKKNPSTRGIPIIFVSALPKEKYKNDCVSVGAVDYIEKPVDFNILIRKIEEYTANE
jgi:CheY-like chemotaxis protein